MTHLPYNSGSLSFITSVPQKIQLKVNISYNLTLTFLILKKKNSKSPIKIEIMFMNLIFVLFSRMTLWMAPRNCFETQEGVGVLRYYFKNTCLMHTSLTHQRCTGQVLYR